MYSSSTFKVFFITATLIHGLLGCSDLRFIGCLQKNTFFLQFFFSDLMDVCVCHASGVILKVFGSNAV